MSGLPSLVCDQLPSARELYHAAIVYQRQPGNVDLDNDNGNLILKVPSVIR